MNGGGDAAGCVSCGPWHSRNYLCCDAMLDARHLLFGLFVTVVLCLCLEVSILRLWCRVRSARRVVSAKERGRAGRESRLRGRGRRSTCAAQARAVPLYRSSHLHAHICALVIDFNALVVLLQKMLTRPRKAGR